MQAARFVLAVVAALSASFAYAQQVCYQYSVTFFTQIRTAPSLSAVCSAMVGITWDDGNGGLKTITSGSVAGDEASLQCRYEYTAAWGPAYGGVGTTQASRSEVPCSESCTEKADQKTILNWTIGYARSPEEGAPMVIDVRSTVPQGRSACHGGCRVSVPGIPFEGWGATHPTSSGLYRQSVDYEVAYTGESCQEADTNSEVSDRDPPPCTGSVGQVNGVPKCIGTSEHPASGDTPGEPGQKSDGNPTAGEKPGSGPRDPGGNGDGGPRGGGVGGPKGSGDGDGDGTTDTPGEGKEQAACGAPGQPKCRIEEAGTPGKIPGDAYDSKLDPYKKSMDELRDKAGGSSDKTSLWNGWTAFFNAPPLATCEQFEFPDVMGMQLPKLNPCGVVTGMRSLMGYLWALGAMWLCIGMVTRTVRGG